MSNTHDSPTDTLVEQVSQRGYSTLIEDVHELTCKDQDRQRLRNLLLEGAASAPASPADDRYFEVLRNRVRNTKA